MSKRLEMETPRFTPAFACTSWAISALSCAALSWTAAGIREKIILPEIICFRKVAL
jgi:hypothetical protein